MCPSTRTGHSPANGPQQVRRPGGDSTQPRSDLFQPVGVACGLTSSNSRPRSDLFQPDATARGLTSSRSQPRSDLFQPDAVARGLTYPAGHGRVRSDDQDCNKSADQGKNNATDCPWAAKWVCREALAPADMRGYAWGDRWAGMFMNSPGTVQGKCSRIAIR